MTYDRTRHHRRSIRLRGYDYARPGAYFLTVVCRERALLLVDATTQEVVEQAWRWLADQYEFVDLDEYVVMPNHLHGIIVIRDRRGDSRIAPTDMRKRKPLGRIVGAFKTVSTKRMNTMQGTPGLPLWQRNYYEHVIRDEQELERVREYIADNPLKWERDPENPARVAKHPTGLGQW